ncbi:flagellar protofilament ribbon protein [Tritrichomonas foetus]|uniref:Flagellar protofilament ribbon protein n=1 Tax=Tritrichomonas foetus TaxID=1144522 RepID=A0A1J4JJ91_9EUKA|nr:flagellar protofilament ribbon protein [Tritrichomonas foetus]|eukprot:OHS97627.1 flagellar protofilament ribbon protein [Tritrichomonas foetus]
MNLRQTSQHEELERRKIELHRKLHAERLARIMNDRNREIGMDYEGLAQQVEERKAREAAEKAEEEDYQRRFLEEQRVLNRMAREEQKIRRQIAIDDNKFREEHQRPEQSREYDIWRPDYKAVQPPVRATDNDPWLSVSGGQKFEGEDLTSEDRHKRQREQLQRWQAEQMAENEHKRAVDLIDQRNWEQKYLENDRRMCEIDQMQKEARAEVQRRQDEENYRTMMEKKRQQAEEKADEIATNDEEINNTLYGAFMSESRNQAATFGRFGQRPNQDWKGMTDEEKLQVIEERRNQMIANQKRREEEAARERREEAERMKATREAIRRERAEARARKQREIELAQEYLRQAEEHRDEEEYRNKDLFGENQPRDDFWAYFSKSHR